MEVVDTDPEMMSKLVDMSEDETEKALKTVGQTISEQTPTVMPRCCGRNF